MNKKGRPKACLKLLPSFVGRVEFSDTRQDAPNKSFEPPVASQLVVRRLRTSLPFGILFKGDHYGTRSLIKWMLFQTVSSHKITTKKCCIQSIYPLS